MNLILFKDEEFNLFYQNDTLTLPFSDQRAKHMIKVLHLVVGDTVKLGVLGCSSYNRWLVTEISTNTISLTKTEQCFLSPALNPVTLILGQVRPICMKRILRDVCAMGIEHLILTNTTTTEKSYSDASIYKNGEYLDFMLEGAMQAATTQIAKVSFAKSVLEAINMAPSRQRFFMDNVVGAKSFNEYQLNQTQTVLAIGPERGFTDEERNLFIRNNYSCVLMGPRIMRTETAVPCGLAVLLSSMKLI